MPFRHTLWGYQPSMVRDYCNKLFAERDELCAQYQTLLEKYVRVAGDSKWEPAPNSKDAASSAPDTHEELVSYIDMARWSFQREDYPKAYSFFVVAAEMEEDTGMYSDGAIMRRQAAFSAKYALNADEFDHQMRLAGKDYLTIAESPNQDSAAVDLALQAAAKCFMEVKNYSLVQQILTRLLSDSLV